MGDQIFAWAQPMGSKLPVAPLSGAGRVGRIMDAEECVGRAVSTGEPLQRTDSATIARKRKAEFAARGLNRF